MKAYGYPLNETFKSISDKYIYKTVYMAFFSMTKMKFEFDQVSQIMKRIALVTSQLYYRREDAPEMIKWISNVLVTMKNTSALNRYLSEVRTPFDEELEVDLDLQEGSNTNRGMNKGLTRKSTIFVPGQGEKTRADIFYQTISSLAKSDDIESLLNKEFVKLVDWFSKFSEK